MTDRIKEGWVEFIRIHCKEGFIDKWSGDQANNPNSEIKSRMNLNSTSTFYRKDGKGEWLHYRDFSHDMMEWLGIAYYCTSDEIWQQCLNSLRKY